MYPASRSGRWRSCARSCRKLRRPGTTGPKYFHRFKNTEGTAAALLSPLYSDFVVFQYRRITAATFPKIWA